MVKNGKFYVYITTVKAQGREEEGLGKCLVKLIILGRISMSFIKETRQVFMSQMLVPVSQSLQMGSPEKGKGIIN